MFSYEKKSSILNIVQGYSGFRPDILRLIHGAPLAILDVGCGAGFLAKDIKIKYPNCKVIGLEASDDLIKVAKEHCNTVLKIDLNTITDFSTNDKFDVIIFADILEHLTDPKKTLSYLSEYLKDDGYIITSIPNIRHYSTFVSIFVLGIWPQKSRGIHDKTHLQFFTKKNILNLLADTGFSIEKEARNVRLVESQSWTNVPGKLLDFWPFRAFFTFQYIHRSKKNKST